MNLKYRVLFKLVKKMVGFGQNLEPLVIKPEADPNPLTDPIGLV